MIHSYTLAENDLEIDYFSDLRTRAEVKAARHMVDKYQAILDELGEQKHRQGQHGDDPVETMTENYVLELESNFATEALLRAEGVLKRANDRRDIFRLAQSESRTRQSTDRKSA